MDLAVRVHSKARLNRVEVVDGPKLRVHVTAPPEGGKANDALVALLADKLGVPRRDVTITRGHGRRDKLVRVEGLDAEEVLARLSPLAGG